MLKNSLYSIEKIKEECNSMEAVIALNKNHEIFQGHFPGQPVLPGACMMQMVKEIVETVINKNVRLLKANEIKFLSLIQPTRVALHISIQYFSIENSTINVSAKITVNEVICCKMKLLLQ